MSAASSGAAQSCWRCFHEALPLYYRRAAFAIVSVVEPLYALSDQRGDGLPAGLGAYALRRDRRVWIGAPFAPVGLIARHGKVAESADVAALPVQAFGVTVHIGHIEAARMEQGAVAVPADTEDDAGVADGVEGRVLAVANGEGIGRRNDAGQRDAAVDRYRSHRRRRAQEAAAEKLERTPVVAHSDAAIVLPDAREHAVAASRLAAVGTVEDVLVLGVGLRQVPEVQTDIGRDRAIVGQSRQGLVVVLRVHHNRCIYLLHVGETGDATGVLARLCENGKEDRCQNRDNCDHNEQFDERKTTSGC